MQSAGRGRRYHVVSQALPYGSRWAQGADMIKFGRKRERTFNRLARLHYVAKKPFDDCEQSSRPSAGIHAEAKLNFAVTFGIVNPQGLLKMSLGLLEVALPEAGLAQNTAGGRCFGWPRPALGIAQKDARNLFCRRQFATHKAANPQAVIGRKSFSGLRDVSARVLARGRKPLSSLRRRNPLTTSSRGP